MFGDPLDTAHCTSLLQQLTRTVQWQHCAHGRPTSAVLLNIPALVGTLQLRKKARQTITGAGAQAGHRGPQARSLHVPPSTFVAATGSELTDSDRRDNVAAGLVAVADPGRVLARAKPQALTVGQLRDSLAQGKARKARQLAKLARQQKLQPQA